MNNVLFDRESLKVVGLNRPASAFEVSVNNVEVDRLSKQVSYVEPAGVLDEEGNALYILPLPDKVSKEYVPSKIETIEVTSEPVIHLETKRVPLLDENGEQVEYEVIHYETIPAVLDEETGEVLEEERVEETPTGRFIQCYTTEEVESQKEDSQGRKLYYKEVQEEVDVVTPQDPLIITENDEQFVEGLERVTKDEEKFKTVSFQDNKEEFTYEDIVSYKESRLTEGTFFSKGVLYESMEESIFSTDLSSFKADLGFGFISLPAGGEVRTDKIVLPQPARITRITAETSVEGLEIKVGALASDLQAVDVSGERHFDVEVSEVYIHFKNPTDKAIDVESFAILV
jgi:hypothetical protein